MTNFERIHSLWKEDLADWLHNIQVRTVTCALTGNPIDTTEELIKWIDEESEDDDD